MRKSITLVVLFGLVISVTSSFVAKSEEPNSILSQDPMIEYPQDVMAIIETKCMNCHKPDARNEKARTKLQWEELPKMELEKLIGKLDAVVEVLVEGAMPPEAIVSKRPEMKLTDGEVQILLIWAESNLDRLME